MDWHGALEWGSQSTMRLLSSLYATVEQQIHSVYDFAYKTRTHFVLHAERNSLSHSAQLFSIKRNDSVENCNCHFATHL